MIHAALIVVLALMAGGDAPADVVPAPGAQIPAAAPALSREVYPPDIKTESEYEGWLSSQHEAFSTAASTGSGGAASAIGLARHANWILAYLARATTPQLWRRDRRRRAGCCSKRQCWIRRPWTRITSNALVASRRRWNNSV
jgi:hypothetical protein